MRADRNFNPMNLPPSLTASNTDSAPPGVALVAACGRYFGAIGIIGNTMADERKHVWRNNCDDSGAVKCGASNGEGGCGG